MVIFASNFCKFLDAVYLYHHVIQVLMSPLMRRTRDKLAASYWFAGCSTKRAKSGRGGWTVSFDPASSVGKSASLTSTQVPMARAPQSREGRVPSAKKSQYTLPLAWLDDTKPVTSF